MKRGGLRSLVPKESQTLQAITDYLEVKKILYIRLHPISPVVDRKAITKIIWEVFQQRIDPTPAVDLILKSLFRKVRESQLGGPDLIVFNKTRPYDVPGVSAFVCEVKAPGEKQSPAQKKWQKRAEKIGLEYHVVESIDQFMELV